MAQNLTYTQCGDYYIPDIRLAHAGMLTLGKYTGMAGELTITALHVKIVVHQIDSIEHSVHCHDSITILCVHAKDFAIFCFNNFLNIVSQVSGMKSSHGSDFILSITSFLQVSYS